MGNFIDLHCDTLLKAYLDGEGLRDWSGHLNLEKMKSAGGLAQCFAVFTPTGPAAERYGISEDPYELFQLVYRYYNEELERNADLAAPAKTANEVKKNQNAGKLSAILTLEDCALLEGKLERVDELAEQGVRMAALTWNYENSVGFPNSADPQAHELGLKPFGIEAVERMNERGIIVDVSHLSAGGFYDVARFSRKPFVASHSCARALCDHSRNLDDAQLRTVGERGGVIGVNFYSAFLTVGSEFSETERIAEHAAYIADRAGIEAVALGSDFDGIDCGLELEDYAGLTQLIGKLEKRFSGGDVERICGGNFLRVLEACAG